MSDARSSRALRIMRMVLRTILFASLAIIAVVAGTIFWRWADQNLPIPFERSEWDTRSWSSNHYRHHRMAEGLVQAGALKGKTKTEIITLLGEPDEPGFHPEMWAMTYVLGPCRSIIFCIDTEFLVLRIDDSGKVAAAGFAQD